MLQKLIATGANYEKFIAVAIEHTYTSYMQDEMNFIGAGHKIKAPDLIAIKLIAQVAVDFPGASKTTVTDKIQKFLLRSADRVKRDVSITQRINIL